MVFAKTRAHRAAGMRSRVDVIARSDPSAVAQRPKVEATKRSILPSQQHGLLRGACHRAALCPDPLARNDDATPRRIPSRPGPPVMKPRGRGVLDTPCTGYGEFTPRHPSVKRMPDFPRP